MTKLEKSKKWWNTLTYGQQEVIKWIDAHHPSVEVEDASLLMWEFLQIELKFVKRPPMPQMLDTVFKFFNEFKLFFTRSLLERKERVQSQPDEASHQPA